MDAETGNRAVRAARDLVEFLHLAQGALERVAQEVHGVPFEQADQASLELQRMQRLAERLRADIERLARLEDAQAASRGHPLRRATDRHPQFS